LQKIQYIRDKRSPIPKSDITSRVMSANKSRNTKPELHLRKELYRIGLSGYRLHWKNIPGKPDITYPKRKIAIFVNGCYWHRCPHCKPPIPKTNTRFWEEKFKNNRIRDKKKIAILKEKCWKVFVFWECKIKEDVESCAYEVHDYIKSIEGKK